MSTSHTSSVRTFHNHISSNGRLVIPELGEQIKPSIGTKVVICREGNVLVLRPVTREFIGSLIGCTKGAGTERERLHQ